MTLGILFQQSDLEPRDADPAYGLFGDRDEAALLDIWNQMFADPCTDGPDVLSLPGLITRPPAAGDAPSLHEFDSMPLGASSDRAGWSLSALFMGGKIGAGPGTPDPLAGIEVDALSVAQDWIALQYEESSRRWTLRPFVSDGDRVEPGWALITFTSGDSVLGYGWGTEDWLYKTSVIPDSVGDDDILELHADGVGNLQFFEFAQDPSVEEWTGLDLNTWHIAASSGVREAPNPVPGARLVDPLPNEVKLYFSVPSKGDSLEEIWRRLSRAEKTAWTKAWGEDWRSGATVFSFEFRVDAKCRGRWFGPFVEYVPVLSADGTAGFEKGDDLDALSIDPATGVVLASLKPGSPTRELRANSGFYAWQISPSDQRRERDLDPRHYPGPLHVWDGRTLDQAHREALAYASATGGPLHPLALPVAHGLAPLEDPPQEADTSCARDPFCILQ